MLVLALRAILAKKTILSKVRITIKFNALYYLYSLHCLRKTQKFKCRNSLWKKSEWWLPKSIFLFLKTLSMFFLKKKNIFNFQICGKIYFFKNTSWRTNKEKTLYNSIMKSYFFDNNCCYGNKTVYDGLPEITLVCVYVINLIKIPM